MLQAHRLDISFPNALEPLLRDVSFSVLPGDKIGLIGANGSGKSTLLRVIEGETAPSAGRLVRAHGLRVAKLPQDLRPDPFTVVDSWVRKIYTDVDESRLRRWSAQLGAADLGSSPSDQVSLGELTRAMLAGLLATDADLLLLDEPTNHLDVESRELIEAALLRSPMAVVLACHDRATLDAICSQTWEIENGRLMAFAGGFSEAMARKERQAQSDRARRATELREVRRLKDAAEKMRQSARGVTKKPGDPGYNPMGKPFYNAKERRMQVLAENMRRRVDRAESVVTSKPFEADSVRFEFPTVPLFGAAVTLEQVSFAYPGGSRVIQGLSGSLGPGSRVAIVGPNGAGKTTLLKLVYGELQPESGCIRRSTRLQAAYLSQERLEVPLDGLLDDLLRDRLGERATAARSLLGRLGLRGDDGRTPVGSLSVGERTKVELTLATMGGANLLLLDEPTNHLDWASIEALSQALIQFSGALLFTSHDRRFIEEVATEIWPVGREVG